MSQFHLEVATQAHCHDLAPRLREEDKAEIWASDRQTPLGGLLFSLSMSSHAWAVMYGEYVACMFGVAPLDEVTAVSWMMASPLVTQHRKAFVRANRAALPLMLEHYSHLMNIVDARYTDSLNWLRWLGYTIQPTEPMGPDGLPFHRVDYWRE